MIMMVAVSVECVFFFFNDTATTEIYTLSLHDALPISVDLGDGLGDLGDRVDGGVDQDDGGDHGPEPTEAASRRPRDGDRKSTRLNSSHANISYAVFCLKKKKKQSSKFTSPDAF